MTESADAAVPTTDATLPLRDQTSTYTLPPGVDPVAVWDAMWEAGTSLIGSYVWLRRHTSSDHEADKWRQSILAVKKRRSELDPMDIPEQQELMRQFIAEEQALSHLVTK